MSLSSTTSVVAVDALLVRDVDGQYRPARAEEVLTQARRVLSHRVRRGATMSSPEAVKDYLLLEIGGPVKLAHAGGKMCPKTGDRDEPW
jgi:DNA repair protein RadC